jgi:hypothetical protein
MVLQFQYIHATSLPKSGREVLSRGQGFVPLAQGIYPFGRERYDGGKTSHNASLCIVAFDEAAVTVFVS